MSAFTPIRVPPSPSLRRWSEAHGFSPELVARWAEFYPDIRKLLAAMEQPPATFVRLNGLRAEPKATLSRLREKGFKLTATGLPDSFRVDEAPFSPGATTEYLAGHYFLQDASSQLAVLAMEPRPDWHVADLCAAPGGKTVALADAMRNGGAIAAFEKEPSRHRSLVSNLARCGVLNTATWPLPGQEAARLGAAFDAVLLDAPCTGEGVIARDPTRKRGQLQEYESCAREQADLVTVASRILKPGGVLVYATCTLAPEENEVQVDRAVRDFGFELEPLPAAAREARVGGAAAVPGMTRVGGTDLVPTMDRAVHLLPHLHGCLGFFVARLRKVGA